ncbi:hypothetical protein Ssi03_24220 [Sphaerisporangium siamense]|uniref:Uncharacterized protein n=1 Tax=Sphaerisporangium siamense TaxID=795645 RepID=A0A7W7GAQ2_9ACTN|nr:DUF5947 family protein [Sphaerisporangium siamense]MBB4701664.1 hypothetical protein [Sphaerisporangium siamense]GII84432.1 hypothetical protein Ssi03_24220 [Sphaerisporangium siamense]
MTAAGPPAGLRRFREPPPPETPRCEMCAEPLEERHGHVVNVQTRALLCTCRGCSLVMPGSGPGARYRGVPERHLHLPGFRLTAADWEALQIPVRAAFFFHHSVLGRYVAFYPSPAGAAESLLPLDAWDDVLAANPEAPRPLPDVEAYLVDRGPERLACHLVPIDACYELVGLVRLHWKGFHGGPEAWRAIDGFFAEIRARAGEDRRV